MIKINLLSPERAKKSHKKVAFEAQIVWVVLLLFVISGAWFFAWKTLDKKVVHLKSEKGRLSTELTDLKVKVKEVNGYEANKKKVRDKIGVIQQLRKNQSMPVALLNEISQRLPERVWLVKLKETSGKVSLSGKATTNSEIVDFVNSLKRVPSFSNVTILESKQKKQGKIRIYSFRLKWTMSI